MPGIAPLILGNKDLTKVRGGAIEGKKAEAAMRVREFCLGSRINPKRGHKA